MERPGERVLDPGDGQIPAIQPGIGDSPEGGPAADPPSVTTQDSSGQAPAQLAVAPSDRGPRGLAGACYAVAIAAAGGVLGILGAAIQELQAGGLLLVFVGAPIIEEIVKPVGVYYVMARRPWLVQNRLYTACLAAIAGLSFGVVESLMYVHVYVREHSDAYVLYRFSVTLAVHMAASFIVGLGIGPRLLTALRGEAPFFRGGILFYVAGISLHACYNVVAVVLSATGVLEFS